MSEENIEFVEDEQQKETDDDIGSLDVIPFQGVLMVIGSDGFHQYNYDCENAEMSYISTIPIERM